MHGAAAEARLRPRKGASPLTRPGWDVRLVILHISLTHENSPAFRHD